MSVSKEGFFIYDRIDLFYDNMIEKRKPLMWLNLSQSYSNYQKEKFLYKKKKICSFAIYAIKQYSK